MNHHTAIGTNRPRVERTPGRVTAPPITPERWREFLNNRNAAHDLSNWTDGRHWIGTGRAPNADDVLQASQSSALELHWPTTECASKFRAQSSQIARRVSFGLGGLLAILTRGASERPQRAAQAGQIAQQVAGQVRGPAAAIKRESSWAGGWLVGEGINWLLSQGNISVDRGTVYRSENSIEIRLSAFPKGRNEMVVTRTETVTNDRGIVTARKPHRQAQSLDGVSDERLFQLVTSLNNQTGGLTKISCPDATVMLGGA